MALLALAPWALLQQIRLFLTLMQENNSLKLAQISN
jgi:hypothetical protein